MLICGIVGSEQVQLPRIAGHAPGGHTAHESQMIRYRRWLLKLSTTGGLYGRLYERRRVRWHDPSESTSSLAIWKPETLYLSRRKYSHWFPKEMPPRPCTSNPLDNFRSE